MQRTVFRLGKFAPKATLLRARTFSISTRNLSSSDANNGAKKYVENLYRATRNPLWHLVDTLQTRTDGVYPYNALHDVSIEEFKKWEPVLSQVDIEAAVLSLHELGDLVAESPLKPIPSWIVLSLVRYKVKNAAHASDPLMDLVFSHINSAPADVKAPLLILTAYQLARFNLLLPLRRVLNAFLELEIPIEGREQQYNAFLHALSSVTFRSVENTNNVNAVLTKMDEQQLKLRSSTYDALLRDHFATFLLAKSLFVRMVDEDRTPTYYQLESLLRIFTEQGQTVLAERFFQAIHTLSEGQVVPEGAGKDPRIRANTLLLNSFDTRKKATKFLRRLVDDIPDEPAISAAPDDNLPPSTPPPLAPSTASNNIPTRQDLYAKTAAFHVAAKDLSAPTSRLFDIFHSLPGEPNIVTYTILIRGLLARREYRKAEIFFSKLLKRRDLVIDQEALTAGVQALTRNGKPHEAFQLLERYALKPEQRFNRVTKVELPGEGNGNEPPLVELTTISMNEFLVALNRIERPDVVFRLWDNMGTLYSVQPNSTTLSILLQSARLAYKKDDSLAGVVAKLKRLNPFKTVRNYRSNPEHARIQAVDEVISCVGHPSRGSLRRYTDGVWKGQDPVDFARKVFLRVLFGNDAASPGGGRLWDVESPASATRRAYDDDPSSTLGIHDLSPKKYIFDPPPDLLTPTGKSYYPSIIITNNNFFNYIALLGVSSRAAEIPLILAWMRELGVQPSESTLALALVLWFEVSVQAPLVEKWSGGEERGEFWRLREWVAEWVGERRVPSEGGLMKWRYIVNRMREVPK